MSKLTQLASIVLGSLILSGSSRGMDVRNYFPEGEVEALADSSAAGRIAAADRALKLGADPNFSGKNGMTPLIWTLIHGNKAGFLHLLARGGNPNQEMADGRSVMSLTAQQKDAWFLNAALAHGGDPNVRSNQDQTTPIFDAILARRAGNVEILLRHGANPNAVMSWGESPLTTAAATNQYEIAYLLLTSGADPARVDHYGHTVLSIIRRIRTDPNGPEGPWRAKVIDLLRQRGLDTEHGQ